MTSELSRLIESAKEPREWQKWGPYLSERLWGTVRECFSHPQEAWRYTTFETAHQQNYLTGDDGIFGWCDSSGTLCFSFAFWNGKDPILKERFFGLSGIEGIHGEDVKEIYFYLDAVPTYSYAKAMYRYPCEEFPYNLLRDENNKLMLFDPEFEIINSGVFDKENFFDIYVEIAKNTPSDIIIKITGINRSKETKPLHIIPQFWFRNTWLWASILGKSAGRPSISKASTTQIVFTHPKLGEYRLEILPSEPDIKPQILFTENDAYPENLQKFTKLPRSRRDAFTQAIVNKNTEFLSKQNRGTKIGIWYDFSVSSLSSVTVTLRLSSLQELPVNQSLENSEKIIKLRKNESDEFYNQIIPQEIDAKQRELLRQAYAGLLWTRIFYNLPVEEWLKVQNKINPNLTNNDFEKWYNFKANHIIAVPDKWEYPWFASWDLPFILIPTTKIDPIFALEQMKLFLSNQYQNLNGQIPSSEWNLSSITPPVIPWGINKILEKINSSHIHIEKNIFNDFLMDTFCSIYAYLLNWLNQKDSKNRTILEEGLIGLDNLQIIERYIDDKLISEDSNSLFWTPLLVSNVIELSCKVFDHFPLVESLTIRLLHILKRVIELIQSKGKYKYWNDEDGYFYPYIRIEGNEFQLNIRNFSSLTPLLGITFIPQNLSENVEKNINELFINDEFFSNHVKLFTHPLTEKNYYALITTTPTQINKILSNLINTSEFLSNYGIRTLSRYHREKPVYVSTSRTHYEIKYCPGELESRMFGGNTNWNGPIWLSLNYLIIDCLEKLHICFPNFRIEQSPNEAFIGKNFHEIAQELRKRLIDLFTVNTHGVIPSLGAWYKFRENELWQNLYLFYEYFNGDTGEGIGASHQTGWTALITEIILDYLKG